MNTLGFTIDANVPIPKLRGRLKKTEWTKWPFDEMNVGDSFFAASHLISAARATHDYMRLNPPKAFLTRSTEEDPITKLPGTRVWRIR